MMAPMGPVSLTVSISMMDTTKEIMKAAKGPKIKPPMMMITSLGSYLRKGAAATMGMRPTSITRKANAASMAIVVIFLVLEFFILKYLLIFRRSRVRCARRTAIKNAPERPRLPGAKIRYRIYD